MSKWSDSAELLQKIISAKEVIPIQSDLINLQQTMFMLQTDQMKLVDENKKLKDEVLELKDKKKYIYEDGHRWMIEPERQDIKLCPICLNKEGFESPLSDIYEIGRKQKRSCNNCKNNFN